MKHGPVSEDQLARRAIREAVCPNCYQRPEHSEQLGPEIARECEPGCTIFLNLPSLQLMVKKVRPGGQSPDDALREMICLKCTAAPTSGDFCSEALNRTCPLSRYNLYVLDLLTRLRDRHGAAR